MSDIPADWIAAAVTITSGFEVQGDPYIGVSGDFDDMGISCGALQWNIGSNSLQPMVTAVGEAHVKAMMPTFGGEMWQACTQGINKGLKIVRTWQNGSTLKAKAKAELKALMGSPQMRAEQDKKIARVADRAFAAADKWAKGGGGAGATKRGFCWFFDLTTQNGDLEGLERQDVTAFIDAATPEKADDVICDFLKGVTGTSGHVNDAHQNAKTWRNKATGERLEYLVMSYLRSKTANSRWRHVVLNRKGLIAVGKGRVNSTDYDFTALGL